MKSLLNALHEGRLVELPTNNKDEVLEYLALLIEAIPDIGTGFDIVKAIKERESQANTALGLGVACPHVRTRQEGELLCAVGWSPEGIDYGASDGKKVHLVIMYYIPESQKNSYLKELSGIAKAIKETNGIQISSNITDIQSIRNKLLDWVELAIDKAIPDSKARMIKLEEKNAAAENLTALPLNIESLRSKLSVFPFSVLMLDESKFYILSKNQEIIDILERSSDIIKKINAGGVFNYNNYQITILSNSLYLKNRIMYECIAIKFS
jgi:mannitol/fructose-specific phosphotransferase system IIA component (Ntr-type)